MEQSTKNKLAKIISIASTVLLCLCVTMLLYSTISYSKNGLVKFFGFSFHVIQTPSMEPDIKVGDLVIVKDVAYSEISVGDDILFKCEDTTSPVYGKYIVHRVKEITETEGVYKTYGINNDGIEDKVLSKAEGKVVSVSSTAGGVFSFLTNGRNVIFVVFIVGLLIFALFQISAIVTNASKIKAEKDKEKLQNDEKLKERLRQELLNELQDENNAKNENVDKIVNNKTSDVEDSANFENETKSELNNSKKDDVNNTGESGSE